MTDYQYINSITAKTASMLTEINFYIETIDDDLFRQKIIPTLRNMANKCDKIDKVKNKVVDIREKGKP